MPDTTQSDTAQDTASGANKTDPGASGTGAAGSGGTPSGLSTAQSGGRSDAGALNPDPENKAGAETPKEAAKDPTRDPSVAGTKAFAGQNTPAVAVDPRRGDGELMRSAIEATPHKIKGFDVTQPPALDLDSGLSRTTLFEKVQDDKAAKSAA